jgi:WD40 repeat protein
MKRTFLIATVVLTAAILLSSCAAQGSETGEPAPLPSVTAAPGETALPTPVVVITTQTAAPQPTEPPAPTMPDNLQLITYRTFVSLEELASLPYADVIDLDFSPDHRYLRLRQALTEDTHRDTFLDLETGEEVFNLEGGQRVYFSPASVSIAALDGGSLTVYDLGTGEIKLQYNSRNDIAALSPDGKTIIEIEAVEEGSGTTFRVLDLTTEEEVYRIFINGELDPASLQFDEDGKLLSATSFAPPNTYISAVWDLRSGRLTHTTYGYKEIAIHPFGSEIAVSNAKQSFISLVSTVTWEQKVYLGPAVDGPSFHDVAYSSRGRLIYALIDGEDGTSQAWFWYPPSGEQLPFPEERDTLAVAVSPDLQLIASSQKDGSVVLWGIPK